VRNKTTISGDDAEAIAIKALGFFAADPERLGRFLAITGIGPQNLRDTAMAPGFLAAVLTYLMGDESLLLSFAVNEQLMPERISQARDLLARQ
jgi:hypothetical protein